MARVEWTPNAAKSLKRIHKGDIKRVKQEANKLENWPGTSNVKKLNNHKHEYRLRIGNYRVFFNVIEEKITIIRIEEVKKRDERTY